MNKLLYIAGKRGWAYCYLHNDKEHPNLGVQLDGQYKGHYKCFACGITGKLTEDELKEFVKDVPVRYVNNKQCNNINWEQWNESCWIAFRKNESISIDFPFNVCYDVLYDLQCGWWMNAWSFPMRDENNYITGLQLRFKNGRKRCIEGSKLGLFIPQGIDWGKQDTVFITEGVSDLAVLLDMGFAGIGLPSAQVGHDMAIKWIKKKGGFKKTIIIPDNDDVGKQSAYKLAGLLGVNLMYAFIRTPPYKDLREWVEKEGKETVKKIIEELI